MILFLLLLFVENLLIVKKASTAAAALTADKTTLRGSSTISAVRPRKFSLQKKTVRTATSISRPTEPPVQFWNRLLLMQFKYKTSNEINAFTHRGRDFDPSSWEYSIPPKILNPGASTGNTDYTARLVVVLHDNQRKVTDD